MTRPENIADTAAAVSITFAGLSLADLNSIVSTLAAVVAIVAGLCSAWYYITKTRQLKHEDGKQLESKAKTDS